MTSSSQIVFTVLLFSLAFACHPFRVSSFSRGIKERRWPNARIPYQIDKRLSSTQLDNITLAMTQITNQSCIKFQLAQGEPEFYMEILSKGQSSEFPEGCYAEVIGRDVSLRNHSVHLGNESCFQVGVVVHELLHVIGLFHEQARCDRDDFVKINRENIKDTDEARANFVKKEFQPIGPYDYKSLMHYPRNLFSKDCALDTITPLNDRVNATGQLDGLSPCDIYKINKIYSCPNRDINFLKQECERYVNSSWGDEAKKQTPKRGQPHLSASALTFLSFLDFNLQTQTANKKKSFRLLFCSVKI